MVKVLNREGIQRMVGKRVAEAGGSGGGGGGGISIAQVDAAYVSKAFFDQLFTVHGKRTYTDPETGQTVTEDVIIEPNQVASGEYSLVDILMNLGNIKTQGSIEVGTYIFQNGNYMLMDADGSHGTMIESLTNTVTIGLHNGNGVGWDTRSGSGFMLQLVYDASNSVAKKYARVFDGLRIGDGMLVWDGSNNAMKVINANGTAANLYATGGVAALGMSAGVSQMDAMTFNHLSVKNSMTLSGSVNIITGSLSEILRSSGDSDCIYLLNFSDSSKVTRSNYYYNQYDNVGLHGTNYNYDETWFIDPDGCAKFKRLYLDSTRYLYINGGTLYYYNGSTSRQIAFA